MQLFDRMRDFGSTSGGTGPLTLLSVSPLGFQPFRDATKFYYTLQATDLSVWETGIGSVSSTTLTRHVVLSNSLGTTALLSLTAGVYDIFVSAPVGGSFDQLNHLALVERPTQNYQVPALDLYGPGNDTNQTITANTTLTAPIYCKSLTVGNGAILTADGYPIFAREFIRITGSSTIRANGSTGGASGTIGVYNYGAGNVGSGAVNVALAKGGGGTGGYGGAGAISPQTSSGTITQLYVPSIENALLGNIAGGGSGGYTGADSGGAGGSGGGRLVLAAPTIIVASGSAIEAKGGNGANGGAGTGGGGGGGGGLVYLVCERYVGTMPSVAGGTKGTGGAGGADGEDGSIGRVVLFNPKLRAQVIQ